MARPRKGYRTGWKIAYVRHGDQLLRVSTCKLVKIDKKFDGNKNARNNEDIVQNDMEENRQRLQPINVDFEQQDSEEMVDQNQNKESLVENVDQVRTHEEQSDNLCAGSNMPMINNRIRYQLPGEDWVVAVVNGRGGKATGKTSIILICLTLTMENS